MAHTDKTKPLKVRLWHDALVRVAEHDHRDGVCDLPTTLPEFLAQRWGGGACAWEHLWTGVGVCRCELCAASTWVRAAQRGERQRARVALREQVKEWNATGEITDY